MKITFILVEPARQQNIGAAARALKTMGFSRLRLVNARVEKEARWVAHQSDDILDNAECFPSLEAALADVDFSIASTARRRLQRDLYLSPAECAAGLRSKTGSVDHAALVFGRESSGLTGNEMALCHAATRIPLQVEQPSLNLGQAVMLYAWELTRPADDVPDRDFPAPAYATARDLLEASFRRLRLTDHPNLWQWAEEGLTRFSDRDLGMLMQVLRRLG